MWEISICRPDARIKVANVEIKHIDLNEGMVRVIARQAEAERERRAKVIHAEGEEQAAQMLLNAARTLSQQPEAMQLRYLSTLAMIGTQNNSTIVFPFPTELGQVLRKFAGRTKPEGGGERSRPRGYMPASLSMMDCRMLSMWRIVSADAASASPLASASIGRRRARHRPAPCAFRAA